MEPRDQYLFARLGFRTTRERAAVISGGCRAGPQGHPLPCLNKVRRVEICSKVKYFLLGHQLFIRPWGKDYEEHYWNVPSNYATLIAGIFRAQLQQNKLFVRKITFIYLALLYFLEQLSINGQNGVLTNKR